MNRYPQNVQVSMVNQPGGTESSQTFIISEGQWAYVLYQVTLGNYPIENISPQLIITNQNNEEVVHNYGAGNLNYPFFFPPGTYLMKMISPDMPESNLHAEVNYMSGLVTETINKIIGGVRIKQTTDYDPVGGNSIIKKYQYPATAILSGPRRSDDYLVNHKEKAPYDHICDPPPWYPDQQLDDDWIFPCNYMGRTSASRYSFGDISGGHIAYETAKVIYGQNGENGYSESTFNFNSPNEGGGFPYAPALVYDSRNGLLLSQKDYNAAGVLIRQTSNTYQFDEKHRELSLKAGFLFDNADFDATDINGQYLDQITFVHYNIISETAKKTSTTVNQFDPSGGNPISNTTFYYYDNPSHLQVTREETTDSKGNVISTQNKYPHDITGDPVYAEMINRNMVAPVIEQKQKNITLNKELSLAKTNYQFWQGNTLIEPATMESSVSGFSLQTEMTVNGYDDKGNILEYIGKDGVVNSIIWGYNKQYPVAKVIGKAYSEAVGQSGLNLTIINQPSDDNSLRVELNKLRNLTGAFVTRYTYKHLVGISSTTDPRGITTFYEYDNGGRLTLIRDNENKIIKKICYNYAGQTEACDVQSSPTFYNAAISQTFTRNNCPTGFTGSQVTYTVAANTYSSVISQADADQQAQNNLTANGQAYANANGTCPQFDCQAT